MSHSMENKPRISSAKIEVDREDPALHIQLSSIFTKVVSGKISTMLEAPREEQVLQEHLAKNAAPKSENVTQVTTPEDLAARKSAYKGKNTVVGQLLNVTFEVPEDCIAAKIDMDKIAEINPNRRSSFAERLQGWHIERRQRLMNKSGPRIDWCFRHSRSRKEFRSVVEVVDYILYETYPRNPNKDHLITLDEDMIMEEMLAVNSKGESSSVCDENEKAQRHKEFVERFLRESWLNLMNTKKTEGKDIKDKHEKFSHAEADEESGESETAEEMIEAFYDEMQEYDEEFLYTEGDESTESETEGEMIEAGHNDMMVNANRAKREMNDNDDKENSISRRYRASPRNFP